MSAATNLPGTYVEIDLLLLSFMFLIQMWNSSALSQCRSFISAKFNSCILRFCTAEPLKNFITLSIHFPPEKILWFHFRLPLFTEYRTMLSLKPDFTHFSLFSRRAEGSFLTAGSECFNVFHLVALAAAGTRGWVPAL